MSRNDQFCEIYLRDHSRMLGLLFNNINNCPHNQDQFDGQYVYYFLVQPTIRLKMKIGVRISRKLHANLPDKNKYNNCFASITK